MFERLTNTFDSILALVGLQRSSRGYDVATTPNSSTWGNMWGLSGDANSHLSGSIEISRDRIRKLFRDNPWMVSAMRCISTYHTGPNGQIFSSQIQVEGTDKGEIDRRTSQKIEDAWNEWRDYACADGQQHFVDIEKLLDQQRAETGENLIEFVVDREFARNGRVPLRIQTHEPDIVKSGFMQKSERSGNAIFEGVEYSKRFRSLQALWMEDGDFGQVKRYDIENFLFKFERKRSGQMRGISDFACIVLLIGILADYIDTEMDSATMGAKWLGFIKPAADNQQRTRGLSGQTEKDKKTSSDLQVIKNAIIQRLLPGEEIDFNTASRSTSNLEFFVKMVLRAVGSIYGLPYELTSNDTGQINFSTSKVTRSDFRDNLKVFWAWKQRHFLKPTFCRWMDEAVMSGRLQLRNYWNNKYHYQRGLWIPPEMEAADVLRDSRAMIDQINSSLISAPEAIRKLTQRDPEEIAAENKQWLEDNQEFLEAISSLGKNLSNLKTNPDAVKKEGKK